MQILANLGAKLSLNSAEFKAGLDDATKNLAKFEANSKKSIKNAQMANAELLSTVGKVGGIVAVAVAALGAIAAKSDNISDMADAFDASIGSIVGMGKALEMSGGKADNLQNMLSKLSVNAQNAKEGSDQLRKSFADVGVAAGEVQNLNPDELFARVAEQLAKIPSATERNAKAFELLGKAAKGVDWKKYVEEYQRVADPQLAAAIKESADAWDNMQKGAGKFYFFMVKLLQPVFAIVNAMTTLADKYEQFKEEGGTINFDPNNPMGEGIEFKGAGKPKGTSPTAKPSADTSGGYKQASDLDKRRAEEIAKLKEAFNLKVLDLQKTNEQIQREGELIGLSQQDAELKKLAWKFEDDNAKVQAELQAQINEEKAKGLDMSQAKIDLLLREQETFSILSQMELENAKISEQANIDKIRSRQILTDEEQAGFDQTVSNMAVFGQKSKAAFAAWKAMAIAQAIISTIDGAQSTYTSLSKIPIVGPALGVVGAIAAIGAGMARVSQIRSTEYQGRAAGGSVIGGQPYMVGEKGPELIVPHGSGGTVIPNNRLSGMMGGGGITYNGPYIANLSAIDTQSAAQFLSKNKEMVWAANVSAQRSMPSSR
jgi:hypothetical protein